MQTKKSLYDQAVEYNSTISIITVQIPTFIYPLLKRRNITSNGIRLPVNHIKFGMGKIMMNNIFWTLYTPNSSKAFSIPFMISTPKGHLV